MLKGNLQEDMCDFRDHVAELVEAGYTISRLIRELRAEVCYEEIWELLYETEKKTIELEAKRERIKKKEIT